ncbi:SPOR domain-containing protein [Noviherbaspirillum sp. UKPF54]|uniref:SPOR domain-containing protein n=1 Tax=Noviherbaspirillum sp. UKPF54 TaxID=2601898 RepID=UPI0011B18CDD|nr:SPOR domain-containing protein [Noviherbaspirillum sp. UKPF54]QDZ29983.1 SPOR domain-containing protein [Noviherbaspirillum sp. UKPF54]
MQNLQNLNRQQGGTILGIIIGLVIGLGIALAVAMTINKTPMPFVDKVSRQNKADSSPAQISDLNKPLYGNKAAAKAAAKEFVKEPAEVVQVNAAAQPADAKDNKAPVVDLATLVDKLKKPEAKPAEVKAVDAKPADVRNDVAKDAAAKSDEKWNYYLQAGAFRDQSDAEALRGKLALMGVEARVSERPSENGVLYRVRVGPYGQIDAMNKVRGKLTDNGVDAAVVRIAKN